MDANRHGIALSILQIIPPIMRFLAGELRRANVPLLPPQLGALTLLSENSYNLSELAEQHDVSLPTMSSTISKLVSNGWVTRQRLEQDRRVVMLSITPAGRELIEEIGQLLLARITAHLSEIPNMELNTLQNGLDILQTVFAPFVFKDSGHTA
jgi:DNA-binding MarR family transcriptional regulator